MTAHQRFLRICQRVDDRIARGELPPLPIRSSRRNDATPVLASDPALIGRVDASRSGARARKRTRRMAQPGYNPKRSPLHRVHR